MSTRFRFFFGLWKAVGLPSALNITARRMLRLRASVSATTQAGHEISVRPSDSDIIVVGQIFGWREYDLGDRVTRALNAVAGDWSARGLTPVIIDGGANVGYSSLYFADQYPGAIVLAIEPNAASFEQLKRNCAGHERIIPICAALWSHDRGVQLESFEDGSWSDRVAGAGSTPSLTLSQALALIDRAAPFIIKLDIEGGELEVCGAAPDLLNDACCIIIEPHDWKYPGAGCLSSLFAALGKRPFDTLLRGENLALVASLIFQSTTLSDTDADLRSSIPSWREAG